MPTALVIAHEMRDRRSVSPPKLDGPEVNTGSGSTSNSEYGLSRRDTEQILDYYQSEDAGRTYINTSAKGSYPESHPSHREHQTPQASARSAMRSSTSSSVGRDSNGNSGRISMESVASSSGGVQRRTSQRSAGGADKRRLAVMELDTPTEPHVSALQGQRLDTDVTLLSRRGVDSSRLGSLALVGPPDAQPSNYTGLSPIPASAPATGVPPIYQESRAEPSHSGHHRTMSEAPSPGRKAGTKTSPRDVGIVGTLGSIRSSTQETEHFGREHQRPSTSDGQDEAGRTRSNALTAPVFQTPRSRSPSPLPPAGVPPSSDSAASETPLLARGWTAEYGQQPTPGIGQEKEIKRPVVGSVGFDLASGQPIIGRSPNTTTIGLPAAEPQTGTSQDRNTQRPSGRLPFKPNQSGPSFLHYQPGVHSTAGPLPSPPRHILTHQNSLPPPRPPRVLSPLLTRRDEIDITRGPPKADLSDGSKSTPVASKPPIPPSLADSDYSISAISASSGGSDDKSPALSSSALSENETAPKSVGHHDQTDKTPLRNGSHVREGAFPPSSIFLSHPSQPPPSQSQHQNLDKLVASIGGPAEHEEISSSSSAFPSSVVVSPLSKHSQGADLKRETSWVSLSAESIGGGPDDVSPPSSYPSSTEELTRVPTTAVGSNDRLASRRRASLPAPPFEPHRRTVSLPRTPSLLSMSRPTRSQASSPLSQPPMPKKAPSSWPDAMNFSEVLGKKTAADRALSYAAKIRELATEQTGLKEWLLSVRKERRDPTPATVSHTAAPFRVAGKQSRHVSRNSMASEVTFPIRQDSYTATDLSPRLTPDLLSPTSPTIALPYPSLAHGVGIRKRSSRTFANDSSTASLSGSSRSLGGGFFASIGRKASIKKDRPFPSSSTKLVTSRQAPQPPQPRPVKLGTPPTLPGGPRAPTRSAQRAQSVAFKSPEPPRAEGQVLSMPARPAVESTATLDHRVEKLFDLLPHANKEILAGYLRRAHNQDPMLAIGTYLEDEKQGCLRHD